MGAIVLLQIYKNGESYRFRIKSTQPLLIFIVLFMQKKDEV
ncbi:hypothetical protein YBT020_28856 (plasmid) [Bacillus thuringiensis serovar finitimus YBT-020]|nr:hypothetical protein YBT020_28856 [Bacillus thuringiensis serovar finitimus YBT-020]